MEANTFATTVYARTSAESAFAYLRHLPNLDEWTLGSRMIERIDDDTWMGTASGYQATLCYHVRPLAHPAFHAIEWQCGHRWRDYFKQYPVFVFPADYAAPGRGEDGAHIVGGEAVLGPPRHEALPVGPLRLPIAPGLALGRAGPSEVVRPGAVERWGCWHVTGRRRGQRQCHVA